MNNTLTLMHDLNAALDLLSPALSPSATARITAAVLDPSHDTWVNARTILIGEGQTLWMVAASNASALAAPASTPTPAHIIRALTSQAIRNQLIDRESEHAISLGLRLGIEVTSESAERLARAKITAERRGEPLADAYRQAFREDAGGLEGLIDALIVEHIFDTSGMFL